MLIQPLKNGEILLSHLTDTFKLPMLWIDTSALSLSFMLTSVLWLLEMARWNAAKTVLKNHTPYTGRG